MGPVINKCKQPQYLSIFYDEDSFQDNRTIKELLGFKKINEKRKQIDTGQLMLRICFSNYIK